MASGQRTPPRFVPTLTTVLEQPSQPAPTTAPTAAPEIAAPVAAPEAAAPPETVALSPEVRLSEANAYRLEEQLLHRVLQRVDLAMGERLSDVVSAAVQRHLDTMIPGLRSEIEAVLRTLVSEALARELSENPGSTPTFGPQTLG